MKHKKNRSTSIRIDDSIRVSSNRSGKKLWWNWVLEYLIVFTGSASVLYGFASAFSLPLNHKLFIVGGLLLTFILMVLCEGGKITRYAWPMSFAIATYAIWKFIDVIVNGFFYIENAILRQINQYFGLRLYLYVARGDQIFCVTIFFLVVFALFSLILSLIVWKRCTRMVYLFLVIVVYGSILLLGIVPPWKPFLITLLMVYAVESMDYIPVSVHKFNRKNKQARIGFEGKKQSIRIKSALAISVVTLISMFLAYSILTPSNYEKKVNFKERKQEIQKFLNDFSYENTMDMLRERFGEIPLFNEKDKASGGLNSGKINQVAEVFFTKETALRLRLHPDFNWSYLKGYAGVSYGEDHWGDLSKKEQERYNKLQEKYQGHYNGEDLASQFLEAVLNTKNIRGQSIHLISTTLKLQADMQSMEVEHVDANDKFLYAPYFTQHFMLDELSMVGDQYFRPVKSQNNYEVTNIYRLYDYYDLNSMALDISYKAEMLNEYPENNNLTIWSYEKEYREFVYDVYTKLPNDGLSRLKELVFESDATGNTRKLEMISDVISYLNLNTEYSLAPGLVPKGKDYVEYFLFDNKIGYCAHYASSAVLMLRNNGVPARYVEGYIVTGEDINNGVYEEVYSTEMDAYKIVDIKDTNAHAWIEVYFDGIGWLPIEVTKGYSNSGISEILPEVNEERLTPTATKAPTKAPTNAPTNTVTPTETKAPEPTISVSIPPKQSEVDNSIEKTEQEAIPWYVSLVLWIIAAIVVIALLIYLRYRLLWYQRTAKLKKGTNKKRVLACYREIEQILDYLGYEKRNATSYQDYAVEVEKLCPLLPKGYHRVVLIALRARFSKLEITEKDLSFVMLFYREIRVRIFREKSTIKRFFLKYWKCL